MDEENRTLLALNGYRDFIKQIRQARDSGDSFEEMDLLTKLSLSMEQDVYDKIIPEKILNLNEASGATIDDSIERYINEIEDINEQITKSLDWNVDDFKDSGENKDSKDVLQDIKGMMDKYMNAYSTDEGMLSAGDEFSAIGDAIKHALEEKTISTTTALLLTEPLKHMKDHMFDSKRQEEEAESFYDVINKRLDREDERQGPEQGKEDTPDLTGSVLRDALRHLAENVGNIHPKREKDTNYAAKEQSQKQTESENNRFSPEQKFQYGVEQEHPTEQPKFQENPHKNNFGKSQHAEDVSQKPEDVMLREDKNQETREPEKIETKNPKQALEEIKKLVNKYEKIYQDRGSVLDDEVQNAWKELTASINYAVNNKLIPDDMAHQLLVAHEFLRRHGLDSEKQIEGINNLKQIFNNQKAIEHQEDNKNIKQNQVKPEDLVKAMGSQTDEKETTIPQNPSHGSDLSKKMQNKDVAQKTENVMKHEDETQKPEKTNADKIRAYVNGTKEVQKMGKMGQGRTLDPVALAAYRKQVLQNRSGNV